MPSQQPAKLGVESTPGVGSEFWFEIPIEVAAPRARILLSTNCTSLSERALEVSNEVIGQLKNLVKETGALFGARHYRGYHFLYTLSDHVAHFGLEHHESSDDRTGERTLIEPDMLKASGYLLPHEFVHSWNGKYRRPEGLLSPDFLQPTNGWS